MAKSFYEAIIASGGLAGENFDVAQGPVNTDIIDTLLSTGDGALTENAPLSLISTGALDDARDLDISAMEQDGRVFVLSVRNTDLSSNNLTVSASDNINGQSTTNPFTVSEATDYLFVHESAGVWRAYQLSTEESAKVFRGSIAGSDWSDGTANRVTIVQTGSPGAGEIGPHNLEIAGSYVVMFFRDSDDELVDLGVEVDDTNGNITLKKTGLAANSAGRVIVVGT